MCVWRHGCCLAGRSWRVAGAVSMLELTQFTHSLLPVLFFPPPPPNTHTRINTHTQDFALTLLGGPTEQQVLEQRAAEYAAAEATRRALLAQAEVALWERVQMQAAEAAAEARVAFK